MEFIEKFKIDTLKPADYNPRKINEGAFEKLQESIKRFGIIKPVIINGEKNILTAGHQRTKAMKAVGLEYTPAIKLPRVSIKDEIRFNLFHNSIETNKTRVRIKENIKDGYSFIEHERIQYQRNENPSVVKEICKLIIKYREWGSVVSDEDGNIILNSDYAVACKLLRKNVLVYKMKNELIKEMLEYMNVDYGEYNYDALGVKAYNQHNCQMNRLRGGAKENHSSLYETYVLKEINKQHRIVDFGAGQCDYYNKLSEKNYNIWAYEPHYKLQGKPQIDIREVVKMILKLEKEIKKNGLFDIVVLDSVINSITSSKFEDYVMKTCNALMNENGKLYLGTRNKGNITRKEKATKSIEKNRSIEFFDKDDFSATYRKGVWTLQKFHTLESLKKMCSRYFDKVEVYGEEYKAQIYAICSKPKKFTQEEYKEALNIEFNMEYPNDYRHNKHNELVTAILKNKE